MRVQEIELVGIFFAILYHSFVFLVRSDHFLRERLPPRHHWLLLPHPCLTPQQVENTDRLSSHFLLILILFTIKSDDKPFNLVLSRIIEIFTFYNRMEMIQCYISENLISHLE